MTLQPIFDYKILFKSLIDRKSSGNRVLIKSGRLAFNYIISAIKEKTTINNIILPNLICNEVVDVISPSFEVASALFIARCLYLRVGALCLRACVEKPTRYAGGQI